jgi:hypothetical protein
MYVNGIQITSFLNEAYPSQNANFATINVNGQSIQVGNLQYGSVINNYFSGYMAETYFIDGQQLTPSSFGQTDSTTGIWTPIAYSGTYGTNGFYLKFANSASLGTDSSGNGNTFTVNNLTSVDQSTDSPTNNFATGNPLYYTTSTTFSEGNNQLAVSVSDWKSLISTFGASVGKWYAETKFISGTYHIAGIVNLTGIVDNEVANSLYGSPTTQNSYHYLSSSGQIKANGGTPTNYGNTWTTGDIIGIALDLNNGYVYFSKNGTFQNSGVPTSGSSGTGGYAINTGSVYGIGGSGYNATFAMNFGNPSYAANSYSDANGFGNFSYAVPSGYYSLCSKNLAVYG